MNNTSTSSQMYIKDWVPIILTAMTLFMQFFQSCMDKHFSSSCGQKCCKLNFNDVTLSNVGKTLSGSAKIPKKEKKEEQQVEI